LIGWRWRQRFLLIAEAQNLYAVSPGYALFACCSVASSMRVKRIDC